MSSTNIGSNKEGSSRMGQNAADSRGVSPAAASTAGEMSTATTTTTNASTETLKTSTTSPPPSAVTSTATSPATSPLRVYTEKSPHNRVESKLIPKIMRNRTPLSKRSELDNKNEKLSSAVAQRTLSNITSRQNTTQSSNILKSGLVTERKSRKSDMSSPAVGSRTLGLSAAAVGSSIPRSISHLTSTGMQSPVSAATSIPTPRQQSARPSRIPTKNANTHQSVGNAKHLQTPKESSAKKAFALQVPTTTTARSKLSLGSLKAAVTEKLAADMALPTSTIFDTTITDATTTTTATSSTPIDASSSITEETSPALDLTQVIRNANDSDLKATKPQRNASKTSFSNHSRSPSTCLTARSTGNSAKIKSRSASNASGDHEFHNIIGGHSKCTTPQHSAIQIPALSAIDSIAGDMTLAPHERASEKNKILELQDLEKKVEEVQGKFLQKLENLHPNSRDKLKCSYKLVTCTYDSKSKLLIRPDDLTGAPYKLPITSVTDFKENFRKIFELNLNNYFDFLRSKQPGKDITFEDSYLHLEKTQNDILRGLDEAMNDLWNATSTGESEPQVCKLQKDLQDCNTNLKIADRRFIDLKNKAENQLKAIEKEYKEKLANEIKDKYKQLVQLQQSIRVMEKQIENFKIISQNTQKYTCKITIEHRQLETELQAHKDSITNLKKKNTQLGQKLKDGQLECEHKQCTINDLQASLKVATEEIDGLKEKLQSDTLPAEIKKRDEQIAELNDQVIALRSQKTALEKKIDASQRDATTERLTLHQRLQEMEAQNIELQSNLKAIEDNKPVQDHQPPNKLQAELMELRNLDAERQHEMEKISLELSKAQYNIKQLEEQVQRDQQLLDVRSKLINSLQVNDKDQRMHMIELTTQLNERNNAINDLNAEIRSKSEEFRNLFNTITAKQLELSNQEHLVKLLEESNERSHMLRVRQEEKIARMEEEIAHLKHTIILFQNYHNNIIMQYT